MSIEGVGISSDHHDISRMLINNSIQSIPSRSNSSFYAANPNDLSYTSSAGQQHHRPSSSNTSREHHNYSPSRSGSSSRRGRSLSPAHHHRTSSAHRSRPTATGNGRPTSSSNTMRHGHDRSLMTPFSSSIYSLFASHSHPSHPIHLHDIHTVIIIHRPLELEQAIGMTIITTTIILAIRLLPFVPIGDIPTAHPDEVLNMVLIGLPLHCNENHTHEQRIILSWRNFHCLQCLVVMVMVRIPCPHAIRCHIHGHC